MILSAMPAWMISLIVNQVFAFAVRQLAKFGEGLDWEKVKKDFGERLAKLTAWSWDDELIQKFVGKLIDELKELLDDAAKFKEVLALALAGNYPAAIEKIKEIVLENLQDVIGKSGKSYATTEEGICLGIECKLEA